MQLSDIIADVRARIQEPVASTWTDAQITGWINRGLDDLSEVAAYELTTTLSTVANQNQYALPSDCLRDGVRRLVWAISNGGSQTSLLPVQYVERDTYDKLVMYQGTISTIGALSYPPVYTIWGGDMYILPTPVDNGDNDLTVYYYGYLPYLVNQTDVPVIPRNRHESLVLYATARSYEMIGESNYYAEYMNQYEAMKQMLEEEASSNQRDMPRLVRDVYDGWW